MKEFNDTLFISFKLSAFVVYFWFTSHHENVVTLF